MFKVFTESDQRKVKKISNHMTAGHMMNCVHAIEPDRAGKPARSRGNKK